MRSLSTKKVKSKITSSPGESSILDTGTDNEASEEDIGTHSLMAKDSGSKQPLVEDATALAMHVSASIATLMARRINDDTNPEHGLDWDSILRHYLRFPRAADGSWENSVLSALAAGQEIPTLENTPDIPNFQMLDAGFGSEKLKKRRNGNKTRALEERYRNLESKVDR